MLGPCEPWSIGHLVYKTLGPRDTRTSWNLAPGTFDPRNVQPSKTPLLMKLDACIAHSFSQLCPPNLPAASLDPSVRTILAPYTILSPRGPPTEPKTAISCPAGEETVAALLHAGIGDRTIQAGRKSRSASCGRRLPIPDRSFSHSLYFVYVSRFFMYHGPAGSFNGEETPGVIPYDFCVREILYENSRGHVTRPLYKETPLLYYTARSYRCYYNQTTPPRFPDCNAFLGPDDTSRGFHARPKGNDPVCCRTRVHLPRGDYFRPFRIL